MTKPCAAIRRFLFELVGMDRNYREVINLSFALPVLFYLNHIWKLRKYCNFGTKNCRPLTGKLNKCFISLQLNIRRREIFTKIYFSYWCFIQCTLNVRKISISVRVLSWTTYVNVRINFLTLFCPLYMLILYILSQKLFINNAQRCDENFS